MGIDSTNRSDESGMWTGFAGKLYIGISSGNGNRKGSFVWGEVFGEGLGK